jgi:hypothetical protein
MKRHIIEIFRGAVRDWYQGFQSLVPADRYYENHALEDVQVEPVGHVVGIVRP